MSDEGTFACSVSFAIERKPLPCESCVSCRQELDETTYWFELLKESGAVKPDRLTALEKEADEIIRVLVTAVRTMKRKL